MVDPVLAFDKNSLRTFDENGFMHVAICPISKETVNPYLGREIPGWRDLGLDPEKIYYGYRDGKELELAADTFNGLNVMSEHVQDDADDPQREYIVGSMGTDAVYESPYLKNSVIIKDAEAIRLIDDPEYAKKQISASYRYDPVFEPGVFKGQKYDFVMKNIRGNHVALVEEGRAGADVVVSDAMPSNLSTNQRGSKMDPLAVVESLITSLREGGAVPHEGGEQEAKKFIEGEEEVAKDDGVDNALTELFALIDSVEDADLAMKLKEIGEAIRAGVPAKEEAPVEEAPVLDESPIEEIQEEVGEELTEKLPEEKKKGAFGEPNSGAAMAMDAKLKKLVLAMDEAAVKKVEARFNAKIKASRECRPLIGDVDPMAFDSAVEIYQKALGAVGRQTKVKDPVALGEMVKIACDAKPSYNAYPVIGSILANDKKSNVSFVNLARIRRM